MKAKFVFLVITALASGAGSGLLVVSGWGEPPLPDQGLEQELFSGQQRFANLSGTPSARVVGAQHDFGQMQAGMLGGTHQFTVHNDGDAPLVVSVRQVEGKCQVRSSGGSTIAPGGSATYLVSWQPPPMPGRVQVKLELQTNDPRKPIIPISITGVTTGIVMARPSILQFQLRRGETATRTVEILGMGYQRLPVKRIEWDGGSQTPCFRARLLPQSENSPREASGGSPFPSRKIEVEVLSGLPPGIHKSNLMIFVDEDAKPEAIIPVWAEILGAFHVVGTHRDPLSKRFLFGRVRRPEGKTYLLTVIGYGEAAGKTDLRVQSVHPPFVQVQIGSREKIPGKTSWRWTLQVRVPKDSPVGRIPENPSSPPGRIVLKTTHPEQPELEIPFEFLVVP